MADPNSLFSVKIHQISSSHLRTYRRAARDENKPFTIEVKQYIPQNNQSPGRNDVTIIAAGGIGFPKEVYEPLFAEILLYCNARNVGIRGFWIADSAAMGVSGAINEPNLGNEVSWWDHSRDLLHLINVFRADMPRPLVGLGHSMGGAQIAYLSSLHPALFTSLILVEASIYESMGRMNSVAQARGMIRRRDQWVNRTAAEQSVRKSPYYARWDRRAVERFLQYGLSELRPQSQSTSSLEDASEAPVRTLANGHLEAAHIFRLNDSGVGVQGDQAITLDQRKAVPDLDTSAPDPAPVYSPGARQMFQRLPEMRPWVLWITGTASAMGTPEMVRRRLETTGTGVGGSGGSRLGAVKAFQIEGGQHTVPIDEHLHDVAVGAGSFLVDEMERWRKGLDADEPRIKSQDGRPKLDERLVKAIKHYEQERERYPKSRL